MSGASQDLFLRIGTAARKMKQSMSLFKRTLADLSFFVAGLFLFAITILQFEPSLGRSETIPSDEPSQITGQLVMLSRDVIVVLSPGGTNIIIPLYSDAHVDQALKKGEYVLVSISSNRAVAIRRAAP